LGHAVERSTADWWIINQTNQSLVLKDHFVGLGQQELVNLDFFSYYPELTQFLRKLGHCFYRIPLPPQTIGAYPADCSYTSPIQGKKNFLEEFRGWKKTPTNY
jgi:hypothetical protein